jgi:hypothetical protein
MDFEKARAADVEFDDLESHWMTTPAERYRYGLLFSMLAGLAAVGLIFWRSRKTLTRNGGSGKSESGRKRKVRQSKQARARRGQANQSVRRKLAA